MNTLVVYIVASIWMLVPLAIFWTMATDKKSITRVAAWWAFGVIAAIEVGILALVAYEALKPA